MLNCNNNCQFYCHKVTHQHTNEQHSSKIRCTPRLKNLKNRLTEPTSEGIRETRPQWREQQHEELKRVGRRKKAGGNRGGDDERWEEEEWEIEKKNQEEGSRQVQRVKRKSVSQVVEIYEIQIALLHQSHNWNKNFIEELMSYNAVNWFSPLFKI